MLIIKIQKENKSPQLQALRENQNQSNKVQHHPEEEKNKLKVHKIELRVLLQAGKHQNQKQKRLEKLKSRNRLCNHY